MVGTDSTKALHVSAFFLVRSACAREKFSWRAELDGKQRKRQRCLRQIMPA